MFYPILAFSRNVVSSTWTNFTILMCILSMQDLSIWHKLVICKFLHIFLKLLFTNSPKSRILTDWFLIIKSKNFIKFESLVYMSVSLMGPNHIRNLDQRKNPKWRISSYFHSSFSPIYSPCGANFLTPRENHWS